MIRRNTFCDTPKYIPFETINYAPPSYYYHDYTDPHPTCDVRIVDSWSIGIRSCDSVCGANLFFVPPAERERITSRRGYIRCYKVIFDRIREVGDFVELDVLKEAEAGGNGGGGGLRRKKKKKKNGGVATVKVKVKASDSKFFCSRIFCGVDREDGR